MKSFYMYLCDVCGFGREKPGECPYCETGLSTYSKDTQDNYQKNLDEPMRILHEYQWYI